mgnify:CR=1 FL=1
MAATATINAKIEPAEKDEFLAATEALGLTPSAAIRVFVRMFNRCKGFPFDVRAQPQINFDNPTILRADMNGDQLVVPAAWRDEDD